MRNSFLTALLSVSVFISGCGTAYLTDLDQGGRTPGDADAAGLAMATAVASAETTESEVTETARTEATEISADTVQSEETGPVTQETAQTSEKSGETSASASEGTAKASGGTKAADTAWSAGSAAVLEETAVSGTEETLVYDVSELTYVAEGEYYYDVASVILYLDEYGELPDNFITKEEAKERGWQGGSVEAYVTGAAIGGDYFGNYDGKLPENEYHECDIDTHGYRSRGSRRLIYSDDGKYYYTKDHYETFTEMTVSQCEDMVSVG